MGFYDYSVAYAPPMPVCQVYLGSPGGDTNLGPLEAVIDSDADVTVIPGEYLRQVKAKRVGRDRARSLWGDARTVDVYAVALTLADVGPLGGRNPPFSYLSQALNCYDHF